MKEKVLSGKKHGMLVMLITVALLIASVVGIVFGGMMLEEGKSPALFIVSLAYLCLCWILIPGFKILKTAGGALCSRCSANISAH